jgi:hypothetical protein
MAVGKSLKGFKEMINNLILKLPIFDSKESAEHFQINKINFLADTYTLPILTYYN